jgi:acyl-CoA dehydrogenase
MGTRDGKVAVVSGSGRDIGREIALKLAELAECAAIARISRVCVDDCLERHLRGELDATTASMAKAWLSDLQVRVIDRCVQLFGGYGYMLKYPIARSL